jgi:DNA-binding transcriptional ArsR family regulator
MPPTVEIDCVAFCRALADETRQAILQTLLEGEKSVGDLADSFAASQPTISHHLTVLKHLGLVSGRREGKHVYYSVNQENVVECCGMLVSRLCGTPESETEAQHT